MEKVAFLRPAPLRAEKLGTDKVLYLFCILVLYLMTAYESNRGWSYYHD